MNSLLSKSLLSKLSKVIVIVKVIILVVVKVIEVIVKSLVAKIVSVRILSCQKSLSKIIVKNCHQILLLKSSLSSEISLLKLSSSEYHLVKNCHQKSLSNIIIEIVFVIRNIIVEIVSVVRNIVVEIIFIIRYHLIIRNIVSSEISS